MGLVSRDEDGNFTIGPLTEEQYMVINDSLELAAAWTDRDVNRVIAATLHDLLSKPILFHGKSNAPDVLFAQLPDTDSDEIDCPDDK